eukprot:15128531-Heterocapsa_arctica.AAC.1
MVPEVIQASSSEWLWCLKTFIGHNLSACVFNKRLLALTIGKCGVWGSNFAGGEADPLKPQRKTYATWSAN